MLSFAEELWEAGENFAHLFVRARVFYDSTDLINIEINRRSFQARTGYAFHQKISDDPVPQNVSSVTVQFEVEIVDTEDTSLLLDGVSLRAI
ncbi:MAG TPA: hypothetical protein PKO35_04955 [Candidatus Atribacteria bacterium]|nr:hypothetical protein [Candidatus Atribacteria bacterium]